MKTSLTLSVFTLLFAFLISCDNQGNQQQEQHYEFDKTAYLEKGQQIAGATFNALSTQLQSAMQEGGVPHAVEYCNLAAYPLVDSLSKVHNATIRRTSTKIRNEKDAPTEAEQVILSKYQQMATNGEALAPIVEEIDAQTVAFYAPIKVVGLCLQCHGKVGETLLEENHALIKEYYPNDEAVGYSDGDLRGMWSIQMKK